MKLNSLNRDLTNGDKSLSNSYLQHIVELLRTEVAALTAKESTLEEITKEHIETQKEVVDTKTVNTDKLNANKVTTGSINEKIILTDVIDVLTELKVNGKNVLTDASFTGPFTYKGVVETLPLDAVAGDVYITNDKVNIYNGTGWDKFTLPVGTVSLAEYNKDKTEILNQIANANVDIEKVNDGLEMTKNDISDIKTSLETKVDEAPVDNNPYVRKNGEWVDLKLNDNAVKHTAGESVIDNSEDGIKIESPKVEITTRDFKINNSVLPEVDKLALSKTVETGTDYWYELKFGRSPFDATSSTRPMYCVYGNGFNVLEKANPAVHTVFTKNWQYTKWNSTSLAETDSIFNITAMDKDGNINLIPNDFNDWTCTNAVPLYCSSFMTFNPEYVSEEWEDTVWLFCTGGSATYNQQKPYLVELKDGKFSRKIDVYNGIGKLKEQGFTPFEEGANMYKELGLTSGKSLRSKEMQRICMVTWDVENIGSSWAIIIGGDKNSNVTDPFDPSKCIYIPLPSTAYYGYNCMAATDSAWYLQESDTGKMLRITPDGKVTELTLTEKSRTAGFNYIEYTDINGRPAAAYYSHNSATNGGHYIVFLEEGENGQVNLIERKITSTSFTPVGSQWYSNGFKFMENSYYIFFTADNGLSPNQGANYGSASMKNMLWYWDKKTHTTHAINNFYSNITFSQYDFIEMHKTKDNAIWFPYILQNPESSSRTGELNYISDIDYTDINEENGKDEGAVQFNTVNLGTTNSFFRAQDTSAGITWLYSTHSLKPNDEGTGVLYTRPCFRCQLSATNDDGILCIISGDGKAVALCYGDGNFKVHSSGGTASGRYDCDADKEPYLPDITVWSKDWNKQPNLSGMSHGWVYQITSSNGQSASYTYIGLRYKNGEPDITVAPRLSKLVRCGNCDCPQRIKWEKYAYSQTYDDYERRQKTLGEIRAYINYGGAASGADAYFKEVLAKETKKLNLTYGDRVLSSVDE